MPARARFQKQLLPAVLLGAAALLLVAVGALLLNHQLRQNERRRAIDEARQFAFGLSRDSAEHFWRFREEFIYSLTHLPYERLLQPGDAAPETLVPVRRFLALNQDLLREIVVVGPDHLGRTARIRGENYAVFSPIGPAALPPAGATVIGGVVQDSDGAVRATVSAALDPVRFWRARLATVGLGHPSTWLHLIDADGRVILARRGADAPMPPELDPEIAARLARDVREGYEGRVVHRVRQQDRDLDLISAYVPVRLENWTGLLMVSADEAAVLGPAAQAIGTLAGLAVAVFLLLLGVFI